MKLKSLTNCETRLPFASEAARAFPTYSAGHLHRLLGSVPCFFADTSEVIVIELRL